MRKSVMILFCDNCTHQADKPSSVKEKWIIVRINKKPYDLCGECGGTLQKALDDPTKAYRDPNGKVTALRGMVKKA